MLKLRRQFRERRFSHALVLALSLGLAATASAAPLDPPSSADTLDAAVAFSGGSNPATGNLNPASTADVLEQDIVVFDLGVLTGALDWANWSIFVFEIQMTGGGVLTPFDVGVTVGISGGLFGTPFAAGVLSGGGTAPTTVTADDTTNLQGLFQFGSGLTATSARLFVAYDAGAILAGQAVQFMISSGTDFSETGAVPEPAKITLLGLLLGAFVLAKQLRAS